MLEHLILDLPPQGSSDRQSIVAAETGRLLGFARWQSTAGPWWWPLSGGALFVHEQEDEPLLFTVRRCWRLLPRYEVCDADDRPVGYLARRWIRDGSGRHLASWGSRPKPRGCTPWRAFAPPGLGRHVFLSPSGRPLAELLIHDRHKRLTFRADIAGDPFAKMLLLAATLLA
jgi:hypothetical protein